MLPLVKGMLTCERKSEKLPIPIRCGLLYVFPNTGDRLEQPPLLSYLLLELLD